MALLQSSMVSNCHSIMYMVDNIWALLTPPRTKSLLSKTSKLRSDSSVARVARTSFSSSGA